MAMGLAKCHRLQYTLDQLGCRRKAKSRGAWAVGIAQQNTACRDIAILAINDVALMQDENLANNAAVSNTEVVEQRASHPHTQNPLDSEVHVCVKTEQNLCQSRLRWP